jgi:glycosyltransferase involved in cell wall biosynthesis
MMNNAPRFSFIVPVVRINDYVRETVSQILRIERSDWELIIVTDENNQTEWCNQSQILLMNSGKVGPAKKRDFAAEVARGEYLIFIDDDSYPSQDFLDCLEESFSDLSISAIGGPGVTPDKDGFWEKVSGATYESRFLSSDANRYLPLGKKTIVNDWPSVNLSIRKEDFDMVGGYQSTFWPGEDTEFCHKLISQNLKILHDPSVIVFHHRRSGLSRHLKQVGGYGLHRGFFARKFPKNSRKLKYFVPSAFVIYLFFLIPTLSTSNRFLFQAPLVLYGILLTVFFAETVSRRGALIAGMSVVYTVFSHLWYGLRFIQGFVFTRKLISQLR